MKRITILMCLVFAFGAYMANAQTEKGKWFLAGSSRLELNFGSESVKSGDTKTKNFTYFDFDFQPKAGYTIINNLPIGIFMDVDLWSDAAAEDGGYDYKGTKFVIGPFARYYIFDFNGLKPFAEAQVGFGIDNYKYRMSPDGEWVKTNESVFNFRVGGGATYFFNDYVGLDAFLGFLHESYKLKESDNPERSSDSDSKYLYNEFIMQIGVVVMLGD